MTYEKKTRTSRRQPAERTPTGYQCLGCGQHHDFPMYVFAHWRDIIHHTCDHCGMRHSIVAGTAGPSIRGRRSSWFRLLYREFLRS